MPKIEFIAKDQETFDHIKNFLPYPSKKNIPAWFKTTPKFLPEEPKVDKFGNPNTTVRNCMPFLDLMAAGYHLPLPCDVSIKTDKSGKTFIYWSNGNISLFSEHDYRRNTTIPSDLEYDIVRFKIVNPWIVKTEKEYSCIFQSPYMHDIPFEAVSAIVDTDKHPIPVNIPIKIKKNFNGIIPKGTPFVQVIPFKREEWESSVSVDDGSLNTIWNNVVLNFIFDRYKKFFRSKKVFKCPFHK